MDRDFIWNNITTNANKSTHLEEIQKGIARY